MNRWLRFNQLWQLTSALFREIIREPGVLFWGILFPILMSLGLGLAFTKKADVIRKIAIINNTGRSATQSNDTVVFNFLKNKCDKNISIEKETWQWKYIIKDDKLGNSIFLFYDMEWNLSLIHI